MRLTCPDPTRCRSSAQALLARNWPVSVSRQRGWQKPNQTTSGTIQYTQQYNTLPCAHCLFITDSIPSTRARYQTTLLSRPNQLTICSPGAFPTRPSQGHHASKDNRKSNTDVRPDLPAGCAPMEARMPRHWPTPQPESRTDPFPSPRTTAATGIPPAATSGGPCCILVMVAPSASHFRLQVAPLCRERTRVSANHDQQGTANT